MLWLLNVYMELLRTMHDNHLRAQSLGFVHPQLPVRFEPRWLDVELEDAEERFYWESHMLYMVGEAGIAGISYNPLKPSQCW